MAAPASGTAASRAEGPDVLDVFRLHGVLDGDGRPLGEHRAPGGVSRWAVTTYGRCPYPGSRYDAVRPMNVSALRQMASHWEAILGVLAALRQEFVRHQDGISPAPPTLWTLATALVSLPAFLIHRCDSPIRGRPVPPAVAGLYKATLGVKVVVEHMVLHQADGIDNLGVGPTAHQLMDYTERRGLFIGRSEVCAGPPRMVEEFLSVLTGEATAGMTSDMTRVMAPTVEWLAFARGGAGVFATVLSASVASGLIHGALGEALGCPRAPDDVAGLEQDLAVTLGLRDLVRPLLALERGRRAATLRALLRMAGSPQPAGDSDDLGDLADFETIRDPAHVYATLGRRTARRLSSVRMALAESLGWPAPPPVSAFTLAGACGFDVRPLLRAWQTAGRPGLMPACAPSRASS